MVQLYLLRNIRIRSPQLCLLISGRSTERLLGISLAKSSACSFPKSVWRAVTAYRSLGGSLGFFSSALRNRHMFVCRPPDTLVFICRGSDMQVAHTVRRRVRRGNVGVNAWLSWRHYFSSLHPRLKARATSRARHKAHRRGRLCHTSLLASDKQHGQRTT